MTGVVTLACLASTSGSTPGVFRLSLGTAGLEVDTYLLPGSRTVGDGSLLASLDVLVTPGREPEALGSLPALEAGLGIDWQSKVPRLTPVESRSDFAFGLRGGEGFGDGASCGF